MIIDLTKPLDSTFIPFSSGEYTDPPLEISEWGAISNEGFRVSRLSMGTQTGTHIDAPAHFVEGGAMLETLSPDQLFGSFFLVDLPDRSSSTDVANRFAAYRQEQILFLRTSGNSTPYLSMEILQKILFLPPDLWILSGDIEIEQSAPFEFHRQIARAGKFLVEDLDQKAARQITGNGEVFIAPLRLIGVSGSPCRVIVRGE